MGPTPSDVKVTVPDGAVDLFSRKIGLRILCLPDQNRILKAGPSVQLSEAEAMQYVAQCTSVLVFEVHYLYIKHGCGYICMSRADGEPLGDVWKDLGPRQRASVISQLRDYAEQLRSLDGGFLWCPLASA